MGMRAVPSLLWGLLYASFWFRPCPRNRAQEGFTPSPKFLGGRTSVSGSPTEERSGTTFSATVTQHDQEQQQQSPVTVCPDEQAPAHPGERSRGIVAVHGHPEEHTTHAEDGPRDDPPLVPLSDLQCVGWPGYNITCRTSNAYFVRDRVVLLGVEGLGTSDTWRNIDLGDYSINHPLPKEPPRPPAPGEIELPERLRTGVVAVHGIPMPGASSARHYDVHGVSWDEHWGVSRRGLLVEKKIFVDTTILNEWARGHLKIYSGEQGRSAGPGAGQTTAGSRRDHGRSGSGASKPTADSEKKKPSPNRPDRFFYPDVTVLFGAFWHNSVGHGLVDGLYSAFVSLVKFELEHSEVRGFFADALQCERPPLLINCDTMVCGVKPAEYCATEQAFEKFWRDGGGPRGRGRGSAATGEGGRGSSHPYASLIGDAATPAHFTAVSSMDMIARVNTGFVEDVTIGLFETLVFGSGSASAYSCTIGSLPYAHPQASDAGFVTKILRGVDIPRWFRDRMFRAHNVRPRPPPAPPSQEVLQPPNKRRRPRVMVLDNKRFSKELRTEIWGLVNETREENGAAFEFAQWGRRMGSGGMTLQQQLQKFAELDVFVTGPGTATYNALWVPDGAAVVLTGHQIPAGFFQQPALFPAKTPPAAGEEDDLEKDVSLSPLPPSPQMKSEYNRTYHHDSGGAALCLDGDRRYDRYNAYLEGSKLGFSLTYAKFYFMPLDKIDAWTRDDLRALCEQAVHEAPALFSSGKGGSFDVYENLSPFGRLEVDFWRASPSFRRGQLPPPHGQATPGNTSLCHGASGPSQCQSEKIFWELGADYCGYEADLGILRALRAKSGIPEQLGLAVEREGCGTGLSEKNSAGRVISGAKGIT